ncbi:MAG: DUF3465 domain-containing protein, partial [Gammaproteobacteria bacterium]
MKPTPPRRPRITLRIVLAGIAAIAAWLALDPSPSPPPSPAQESPHAASDRDQVLADAFSARARGLQVEGEGIVVKVLPDDRDGSPHQRFILRLASGQTLLVAHNLDLAP